MGLKDKTREIFEDMISFDGITDEDDWVVPLYEGKRFRMSANTGKIPQAFRTQNAARMSLQTKFKLIVESYYRQDIDDYEKELLVFRLKSFMKENLSFMTVKEWRERHD